MLKTYKYRLYPTTKQTEHLNQAIGSARFIYNQGLLLKIWSYQILGQSPSYNLLATEFLANLKRENSWLLVPAAQSLQSALRNLDTAYKNFFKKTGKFPRFKGKYNSNQSVQYPQKVKLNWQTSKVYLPKCGQVKVVLHRKFEGQIKTCTVSRTPTNQFYISILVDNSEVLPPKSPIQPETALGLDLGIKDLVILSDGTKFANPKHLRQSLQKLKVQQRRLFRKKKGSKNQRKQRLKVAKVHQQVANQRRDYLNKVSSQIINNSDNQTIVLEDLSVVNMTKNHKLALSIADCGWGMFTDMLQYKADHKGKNIVYIGRFEPSSKTCSCCGWIKKDLTLKDREWTCQKCQTTHDRDVNAAINIKKFGLIKAKSGQELTIEPAEIPRKRNRKTSPQNRINDAGSR